MTQYAIEKDDLSEFDEVRHKILEIKDFLDPGEESAKDYQFSDIKDRIDDALTAVSSLQQAALPSKHYLKSVKKELGVDEDMNKQERVELSKTNEVPGSLKSGSSKATSENGAWSAIEKKAQEKAESEDIPLSEAIWTTCRENEKLYKDYKREQEYGPYENYENYRNYRYTEPGKYEDTTSYGQNAWQKIREKAETLLNKNPDISDFPDAVKQILHQNPELYTQYAEERRKDQLSSQDVRKRLEN